MTEGRGPSELGEFVGELKRRKVFRVAVVYGVVAFGVVEAAERLFPALLFPEWTVRLVMLMAVLGFPIALVMAWALETTPEGVRRERPRPEPPERPERPEEPEPRTPEPARGQPIAANRWEQFWQAYERASTERERPEEEPPRKRRPWARALLVLLLIAGAVGVYAALAAQRESEPQSPLPGSRSIAVLPFTDLSRGGDREYFADGLAEEILDALGQIDPLDVKARSSSFQFEGSGIDVRTVGDSLGVRYALEGSVRMSGDRVRVTAQLLGTDDGSQVWSESYDRRLAAGELFRVQEEIARSVARALEVEMGLGEDSRLVDPSTGDLEAYSLYLRGRHLWNERTRTALRRATDLFRAAIERDSAFARAHADLANGYNVFPNYGLALPSESAPRARAAAERALELDPELAEAHTALAQALMWEREWEEAERHYRRALVLDPRDATTRYRYAWHLAAQGRMDEALEQAHVGIKLGPFHQVARGTYAAMLLFNDRAEEAAAGFRRQVDDRPERSLPRVGLAFSLARAGRPAEGLEVARRAVRGSPESFVARGALAVVALRAGDEETARRVLGELKSAARPSSGEAPEAGSTLSRSVAERAFWVAGVHAARSQPDSAFRWLLRVEDLDAGARPARGWDDLTIARLRGWSHFDLLRSDPRYGVLLSRLGVRVEE